MDIKTIENAAEAILFVSGESVEIKRFAEVFELPESKIEKILMNFADRYNYDSRGLKIIRFGDDFQLSTRPEYKEYLEIFAGSKKPNNLSNAALEVLSIIAYNQPVTRATIDKIRGVDSFGPLEKLVAREIVEEVGRLDAPGRPILYGTTKEFLKIFGLKNLDDIPDMEAIQLTIEDLEEQSEETGE